MYSQTKVILILLILLHWPKRVGEHLTHGDSRYVMSHYISICHNSGNNVTALHDCPHGSAYPYQPGIRVRSMVQHGLRQEKQAGVSKGSESMSTSGFSTTSWLAARLLALPSGLMD